MLPTPPRSPVPPQVVLAKLGEPDVVRRHRHRSHSDVRRSSSLPRQKNRTRVVTVRPFSLTSSMERNLQHLHRIGKELEEVNRDLTTVIDKERHLSVESNQDVVSGDVSSVEESSVSLDEGLAQQELSRDFYYSAVQNLELAGLAFEEFVLIMADIKLSYQIEQKELFSRASCLTRESESFKKMSSDALAKLRTSRYSAVH
jgi:type II secretory pathway component PulL